jgi:uncharacterized protein YbjT (DUF2867 family)
MILVTGATGNVGRPLIDALNRAGASVRAITRNRGSAKLPAEVEVIEGNPSQPETIAAALKGVTSMFFNPMAVQSATSELLALASKHGVKRVVALSGTNVDDDPSLQPSRMRGVNHKEVEDELARSGLEWVALRCSLHATSSMASWGAQVRAGDVIRGPYAASGSAPLHEDDVAAVSAHALLTDELVGTRPAITGPETLTQERMVGILGSALGRPLVFQEVPAAAAKQAVLKQGFPFPESLIDRLFAMQAKRVGEPEVATGEVARILGRPALTYARWASDHASGFRRGGS